MNVMRKYSTSGIFISVLLVFSIFTLISISEVNAAEVISVNAKGYENTIIIEFENESASKIKTIKVWPGGEVTFTSFKSEPGWGGGKYSDGKLLIFTATNTLNPGESVKFGLVTDEKVNAINWKALDRNDNDIDKGKISIQVISETSSDILEEESKEVEQAKETGSELYGTKKFIPEQIRSGSDIRLVGSGFGSEKNLKLYLDSTILKSVNTDKQGNFLTTISIPDAHNVGTSEFIIKDEFENILKAVKEVKREIVRGMILDEGIRADGRKLDEIRPITIETNVLPRAHGSCLFTRGQTQALAVATRGGDMDAQVYANLTDKEEKLEKFMLHYNFPPFSVGETGRIGTGRREIGHGKLAWRALNSSLPEQEKFPYTYRIVSEITESNGSSSMATVCGSSLALMDAGVPMKDSVAGIAMGLIKEGNDFSVLSDILGDEDHLGDMDFKVAGTKDGVTALQMDIKIQGINESIMKDALEQAKTARLSILVEMNNVIDKPSEQYSKYAPSIITLTVAKDKIRDVIGKGGSTIRSITEVTGAQVDINDTGLITIASVGRAAGEAAKEKILLLTADVEVGKIYEGRVAKIMDFGAFVTILPGKDGLVHISEISEDRVKSVNDVLSEGQIINVKVIEIDRQKRVRLSMRKLDESTSS